MRRPISLLAVLLFSLPLIADDATRLFIDKCAVCHSVGSGERAGPDLIVVQQWTDDNLRTAVKRMEANVGPLTNDEVAALITLLKTPGVKELIAAAESPAPVVPQPRRGSPQQGRQLFNGDVRLANGGAACVSCHAVAGRGGNLAMDLTLAHSQIGAPAILGATRKPVIPLMKAAYAKHPIADDEATDLAAFLEESSANASAILEPEQTNGVNAAAGGFVVATVGVVGLTAGRRRAGVRSRLAGRRNQR